MSDKHMSWLCVFFGVLFVSQCVTQPHDKFAMTQDTDTTEGGNQHKARWVW